MGSKRAGGGASGGSEASAASWPPPCCGRPLELLGESASGRRTARRAILDQGIPIARWRCPVCGRERHEGWVPATWVGAVARAAAEITAELEEDIRRRRDHPPEGAGEEGAAAGVRKSAAPTKPPEGRGSTTEPAELAPLIALVERVLREQQNVLVSYLPEPLLLARDGYERYIDSKLAPEHQLALELGQGVEEGWDALVELRKPRVLAKSSGMGGSPHGGWSYALKAVDLEGTRRLYVEERSGELPQPGIFLVAVTEYRGKRADDEVRERHGRPE